MCGLSGFLFPGGNGPEAESILRKMTHSLEHRGPDDSGIWCDHDAGINLGHTRLAILDVSPLGHQPMISTGGRFVITYNGEIYNHQEIRGKLAASGATFRGNSDTETLVESIAAWGVKRTIKQCIGMFAFAVWDRQERELWLGRDRLGIKPLYYGFAGKTIVFGSELKALMAHSDFKRQIDPNALSLYFRHGYIPSPHCIFKKTYKLEPGSLLKFKASSLSGETLPTPDKYWDLCSIWKQGELRPYKNDAEAATSDLEALLTDAVGLRMLSDVPLGAFLSGGIDSSTIVALMQKQSPKPIKTFSIGFEDKELNEAEHAKAIAHHLGTDHTSIYITARTMRDIIPDIPTFWDEPFADSSQIPTYCVSQLTRRDVTVCLSGDGGDELFAGYSRYGWANTWNSINKMPPVLRRMAKSLKHLPPSFFNILGPIGPKIHWRLDALGMQTFQEYYRYFVSTNKAPDSFVLSSKEPQTALTSDQFSISDDTTRQMTLWDTAMYLPDDILTKVDRASMAVSLEARVPLLDHRVVEFAASLPSTMKVRDGLQKWILRQVLYKHVPRKLVERPKQGFAVPLQQWLSNDLRDWCEDLLDPTTIAAQGYIDSEQVASMWHRFKSGEHIWCHQLWQILMFQSWLSRWKI